MIDPEKYAPKRGARDDDDDDADTGADERVDRVVGPDDASLDQLLDSYADTSNYVYLRRQELGEWTFLAKLEISDAKLDQIQSRFGGGKFRVQIIDVETSKQKAQRTFRIAGKAKNDDDVPSVENPPPVVAPTNGNGDHVSLADVLKIAMTALTARPTVDPLMQTLITALVGGRKNGDSVDPLELQKLLLDAETRGYNRGKELGEAIASAGGEGDGVARALAANLPAVVDAFKSAQQSYVRNVAPRSAPMVTRVAAPEAAPGIVNEPGPEPKQIPTTEGEAMGLGWINALRPAVPVILQWARSGKDAAVKAANTIDDLRDDIRDAIAVQAEEPDFVPSVIRAIPEFQAPEVQSWVTVFLSTIQEILTTPDDEGVLGGEVNEA